MELIMIVVFGGEYNNVFLMYVYEREIYSWLIFGYMVIILLLLRKEGHKQAFMII